MVKRCPLIFPALSSISLDYPLLVSMPRGRCSVVNFWKVKWKVCFQFQFLFCSYSLEHFHLQVSIISCINYEQDCYYGTKPTVNTPELGAEQVPLANFFGFCSCNIYKSIIKGQRTRWQVKLIHKIVESLL